MGAAFNIDLITFNANEAAAVDSFFDDLAMSPSAWSRRGPDGLSLLTTTPPIELRHVRLGAQGNVIAAAALVELFTDEDARPELALFYGCAGALDARDVGHVFFVGTASYASLGTVEPSSSPNSETVTLKNKWLCDVNPREVSPLDSIEFPEGSGSGTLDLQRATTIDSAHVVATDKVVRVQAVTTAPRPSFLGPPRVLYTKAEWSYGEALAFVRDQQAGRPVLVEMESYGIGACARAMKFLNQVLILRVVTDDLVGHGTSNAAQAALLMQGRVALARVLLALVTAQLLP